MREYWGYKYSDSAWAARVEEIAEQQRLHFKAIAQAAIAFVDGRGATAEIDQAVADWRSGKPLSKSAGALRAAIARKNSALDAAADALDVARADLLDNDDYGHHAAERARDAARKASEEAP